MKKQKIIMIIALIAICLSPTIKGKIVNSVFRYETPQEAFEKSGPRRNELVAVLEDNGVALLIYKKNGYEFYNKIIAKDSRGWAPLSLEYKSKKDKMTEKGFVDLLKINGKYVVHIMTGAKNGENISDMIYDNLGSEFLIHINEFPSGELSISALLVLDEIPDDYKVIIDDLEISMY